MSRLMRVGLLTFLMTQGCHGPAPSVLLVAVDTLRADRVGPLAARSGARSATPRLDEWSRGAAVFRRAVTPAPFTMPAMAAVLTGSYPDRCGVAQHEPGTTLRSWSGDTLAEAARRGGARTAAIVANPWLVRETTGFDRGFESFARVYAPGKDTAAISATAVTDETIRVVESFGRERFFVWAHYFDPHMPYEPPPAFGGKPSLVMDDFRAKDRDLARIYAGRGYPTEQIDEARTLYDGEVRYADHEIGRLFDALARTGRERDTIVVVVSDHGESLGEHGLFFAHDFTVYDELVRVALILRGPGIDAGTHDTDVSLIDVAPTLCRLASLPCRGPTDGRDLFDLPAPDRTLFGASTTSRAKGTPFGRLQQPGFAGRWTMAVRGPLKLVRIPAKAGIEEEMYDRSSDPGELENIATVRTKERDELGAALDEWSAKMNAERPPSVTRSRREKRESRRALRSLGYLQ